MKKQLPAFLAGVLVATLALSSLPALAGVITSRTTIEVDPINILVNGETFVPRDVNGNEVAVFAYNGTTYAPLRALAEAYGLEVGYDAKKNMAMVEEKESEVVAITTDEEYEAFKTLWNVFEIKELDPKAAWGTNPNHPNYGKTTTRYTIELVDDSVDIEEIERNEAEFSKRFVSDIRSTEEISVAYFQSKTGVFVIQIGGM